MTIENKNSLKYFFTFLGSCLIIVIDVKRIFKLKQSYIEVNLNTGNIDVRLFVCYLNLDAGQT